MKVQSAQRLMAGLFVVLLASSCGVQPTLREGGGAMPTTSDARFKVLSEPVCPETCTAYLLRGANGMASFIVNAVDSTAGDEGDIEWNSASGETPVVDFDGQVTSISRVGNIVTVVGTGTDPNLGNGTFNLTFNLTDNTFTASLLFTINLFTIPSNPNQPTTGSAIVVPDQCDLFER